MIVAGRYASSLMELATESNQLDAVRNDMKLVEQLCKQSRDFSLFLQSPVIKTDTKITVIENVFEGKVSALTLSFLKLITNKHREGIIAEIAEAFDEKYKANKNILTAVITSAHGLDKTTRDRVMDLLRQQMKGEVELIEKTDPTTIGGFVLKIGDKQIDKTVSRQLSDIRKHLTNKALN